MLITALVILAAVVVVASGRGGELAYEHADHAPLDMGPVSAADVALLRPPSALWGYNMQVTDEALDRIARAMSERDIQIAALQQQVADLQAAGLGTATPSDTPALADPWVPADASAPANAVAAAGPADAADSAHVVGANGHLAEPGAAQEAETDKEQADSTGESAGKEAW
jgi:hypothetical protein